MLGFPLVLGLLLRPAWLGRLAWDSPPWPSSLASPPPRAQRTERPGPAPRPAAAGRPRGPAGSPGARAFGAPLPDPLACVAPLVLFASARTWTGPCAQSSWRWPPRGPSRAVWPPPCSSPRAKPPFGPPRLVVRHPRGQREPRPRAPLAGAGPRAPEAVRSGNRMRLTSTPCTPC